MKIVEYELLTELCGHVSERGTTGFSLYLTFWLPGSIQVELDHQNVHLKVSVVPAMSGNILLTHSASFFLWQGSITF